LLIVNVAVDDFVGVYGTGDDDMSAVTNYLDSLREYCELIGERADQADTKPLMEALSQHLTPTR
jgi:hypothetical protein